jgi:hypothetical protein
MRQIVGISVVLFGTGALLCEIEWQSATLASASRATALVRTVDGWERPQDWRSEPVTAPRIHPLVVAAGQGLVSIFALVACHGDRPPKGGTTNARRCER